MAPQDRFPLLPPGSQPYNGFTEAGFPLSKRDRPAYGYTAQGIPVHAYNDKGEQICGRKINRENRICQSPILDETGHCTAPGHGGGLSRGGAPTKHGGRSRILRKLGFAKKLADIEADEQIASHRQNVELYELALQVELELGIPTGQEWEEALSLYRQGVDGGDIRAIRLLGPLLEEGCAKARRLGRALELADKQRHHKEAEAKREQMIESNLNVRQANSLIAAVIAAVEEEVEDKSIRRRIQLRLARLLHRQSA